VAETARPIVIRVNGTERSLMVERSRSLLSVLRTELSLTGTKYGCGSGECGACTVLLEGQPVRACTTPVSHADGRSVTTIEGLQGKDGSLHPVQQAFLDVQAFQCGYCTPGMIMEAVALLRKNPNPTALAIREGMAGHLCRCGTYGRIVRAIQAAAAKMRK
jgi:aerobic-type carbon monoxide dehydrogenase small subunit (CoxS/CutS family)